MAPVMELCRGPKSLRPINSTASPIIVKSHTDLNMLRFEYRWKGLQCDLYDSDDDEIPIHWREKTSPVFSPESHSHLRWSLRLNRPLGWDRNQSKQSIFLCYESSEKSEVEAKFWFYYDGRRTSNKDSPSLEEYCVFKHGTKQASYGYNNFCDPDTRGYRITCEIEVLLNDDMIADQCAGEPFNVPDSSLLDDMVSTFEMKKHSDFIITNGEFSIPVHKVILSVRSTVFASMFEHDTKEQQENRVDIPDITIEALKELIRYLYTDKVMGIEAVARDLLAVAEKYCLDRLKAMCEEALRGILGVENAAEILMLADLHRADQLKTRTIEFINARTLDVMDTPGFKSMTESHPRLLAEIMRASATERS